MGKAYQSMRRTLCIFAACTCSLLLSAQRVLYIGDHLHPSERAYEAMAQAAAHKLIRHIPSHYDHEEQY